MKEKIIIIICAALSFVIETNANSVINNSECDLLSNTFTSSGISGANTNDVGVLISIFLSENKHGQCAVPFTLFKNSKLSYRGDVENDDDYSFNFLYTGNLFINGRSLESFVGRKNWKIILRGSRMGASIMEVVSNNGSVNDSNIDQLRVAIARSLSASLIKEQSSYCSHDFLYKNAKGYILFSYSWGNVYSFNLYASGNTNELMGIMEEHGM